ncbi:hypothetical protein BAE44_0022643 [Dichanthelium oligosanthes]|uniref:RING-type domain-containing protein n=1 Tax=Dichanthelium oligosanthes TaxID=888268 RepID=A0A1E5UU49_9POAL|nr:hypothetical protein BAE44_0022643 [Dichanthelium oligosanthes]
MAVQAHYHHHHHHRESPFLASRGGGAPESSSRMAAAMEMQQAQKEAMAPQQAPPLFLDFSHGDFGAGRKRQREAEAAASMSPHLFSLQPQAQAQVPKVISLAQLHKRPAMGLRLDFDDGSEHVSSTSSASASCLLSDELAAQRNQHRNEMDRLIQEHTERLRLALADIRRRQYRSLLVAAEAAAAQRIRKKEAEASEAARRGADLEDRVARLRAEAAAWQAKALADQSTATALHAQLQQAAAAAQARGKAEEEREDNAADDAGSCFVDPDRVVEIAPPAPPPARPCRTCRRASASVVLLPCRHLCVCADCEPAVPPTAPFAAGAVAAACPMCRGAVTGTVQVFFS